MNRPPTEIDSRTNNPMRQITSNRNDHFESNKLKPQRARIRGIRMITTTTRQQKVWSRANTKMHNMLSSKYKRTRKQHHQPSTTAKPKICRLIQVNHDNHKSFQSATKPYIYMQQEKISLKKEHLKELSTT
jgi:hypothetical protein